MGKHGDDCECGCGCDGHDEQMTVTLTLDDGSELECVVLTIFPVGEKKYIALLPMTDSETEEDGEVFLYHYNQLENEEIELLNIEDDDEYEAVADAFDELLDDEDFDEMFEDEEEK
jgi:uncharacterized protein YrzB (UPF0473 family)